MADSPARRSRWQRWRSGVRRLLGRLRRATARDPDAYLKHCRSIVHVGANSGQERTIYAQHDLAVLWIEPIADVFDQLVENIEDLPRQRALRALVTDRIGDTRTLHIASNKGASSSILELGLHKEIWPDVHYVQSVSMQTSTVDSIMAERPHGGCDALIMDTQGSELLVLRGAEQTLRQARYVKTECADFEAYVGCALCKDLTDFLASKGFSVRRKDSFARRDAGGQYYDILFERK